jgi:hypothetical protein
MTPTQNAHAIRISTDALDHLFRQVRTYNAPYATTGRKSFQPPGSGMAGLLPRLSASEQSFYKSAIYKSLPKLIRKTGLALSFFGKGTEVCNG